MSAVFLVLLLAATIGYAFNNTLMVQFLRTQDRVQMIAARGICLLVIMAPLLVFAATALAQVTRGCDPLFAAWAFEGGIGILATVLGAARWLIGRAAEAVPPWPAPRLWRSIAPIAAPTLIGIGYYALATAQGPISIAAAVMSSVIVASTILARIVYRGTLSLRAWILVVGTCAR